MEEYPSDMAQWKQRAKWLADGFHPTSKQARAQFKDLCQFLNGNSMEEELVHWCKGCCSTDEEALQKAIQWLIPVFARGFQCPLLYRFKHYSSASSYIRTACCFFKLLPRVLKQMQDNMASKVDSSSKFSSFLESILEDTGEGHIEAPVTDLQAALDDLLENDLAYSLQNSIRRRNVMEQVSKPDFTQSAVMIDIIVDSLEYGSNVLFKRTAILTKMSGLGSHHPKYKEFSEESKKYFLQITSGMFGETLMGRAMNLLGTGLEEISAMGFAPTSDRMELFFRLIIACVSDLWRRLVLEYSGFPFKWFGLLKPDAALGSFSLLWEEATAAKGQGCSCIDWEFSSSLMQALLTASEQPAGDATLLSEVTRMLDHIASCAAVTSDSVEVKHGRMQWTVSKRGSQFAKQGRAATESALLHNIVNNHRLAQQEISEETLPPSRSRAALERSLGISSRNQHSASTKELEARA